MNLLHTFGPLQMNVKLMGRGGESWIIKYVKYYIRIL